MSINNFNSLLNNFELMTQISIIFDEFAKRTQHVVKPDEINEEIEEDDADMKQENLTKTNKNNKNNKNITKINETKKKNNKNFSFKNPLTKETIIVAEQKIGELSTDEVDMVLKMRNLKKRRDYTRATTQGGDCITIETPANSYYSIYGKENGNYFTAKAIFSGNGSFNINLIPGSKKFARTPEDVKFIKAKLTRIKKKTKNAPVEYRNTKIYVDNIETNFDIYSDFEDEFLASTVSQINTEELQILADKIKSHSGLTPEQRENLDEIFQTIRNAETEKGLVHKVLAKMFPHTDKAIHDFIGNTKETMLSGLTAIADNLDITKKEVSESLLKVLIVAVLIVALRDHKKALCVILIPLILHLLAPEKITACLNWIREVGQSICDLVIGLYEWQHVNLNISWQVNVYEWVTLIPGIFFGKKIYEEIDAGTITSFITRNISNSKQGITDIVQLFFNVIQAVTDQIGCTNLLATYGMSLFTEEGAYIKYADDVKVFDEKVAMGEIKMSRENYETLLGLINEGKKLQLSVLKGRNGAMANSCITHLLKGLENLQKQFRNSGFATIGLRQEPVCILLRGGPGVFKTQTVQHLCRALCAITLKDSDLTSYESSPESFVYNRQIETEYWEGYNSTKHITIIDDFAQYRENAGSSSESMEMIRMINENPALLHMASMENKANTTFSSKFVIATTNAANINPSSIIDQGALFRRFNYTYTVAPRTQYRLDPAETDVMRMKFDKTKLPLGAENISSTQPFDILEFHEYDMATRNYTGRILNFDQVLSEVVMAYSFRKKCYDQKMKELEITSNSYKERKREFLPEIEVVNESQMDHGEIASLLEVFHVDQNNRIIGESSSGVTVESLKRALKQSVYNARPHIAIASQIQRAPTNLQRHKILIKHYKDSGFVSEEYYRGLSELTEIEFFEHWTIMKHVVFLLSQEFGVNEKVTYKILSDKLGEELAYITTNQDEPQDIANLHEALTEIMVEYFENRPLTGRRIFITDGFFTRWRKKFINALCDMGNFFAMVPITFYAGLILKTAATMLLIKAATMFYRYLTGDNNNEPESGHGRKPHAKRTVRRDYVRNVPQISLTTDVQCQDILKKVIKSNVYELRVKRTPSSNFIRSGQGLFVTTSFLLLPHHFLDHYHEIIEEGDIEAMIELTPIYNDSSKISTTTMLLKDFLGVELEDGKLTIAENAFQTENLKASDLALIDVPRIAPKANILKYISSRSYVQSLNNRLTIWLGQNVRNVELTQSAARMRSEVVIDSKTYEPFSLPTTIEYTIATKVGDCGSVLAVADVSNPIGKICGMHVAGNTSFGIGYSSIFCREDIEELFESINRSLEITAQCGTSTSNLQSNSDEFMAPNKVVASDLKDITYPTRTKIMPSPLYAKIVPPKMMPSKVTYPDLRATEENPWFNSYATYNMNPSYADFNMIHSAAIQYKDMLFKESIEYVEPRLYTYDEAILGIPGTEYGAINRNTSVGYPDILNSSIQTQKRKYYFGSADEYDLQNSNCKRLESEINAMIENAKKGIRDEHIYVDYLKDELRDFVKVEAAKTRLFSSCPLRLLILYRMYFGAFQHWFQINRVNNQSSIGLNPYSIEWDVIAKRLTSLAPLEVKNIGAGDYKGFDGSENPSIHWEIFDIIQDFYNDGDTNKRVRRILWYELTNSVHYFNGRAYEWVSSLPSGHPMTAIVNNMYNGIAFRYCWKKIYKDTPHEGKFNEDTYLITMGDDNVFAVRPEHIDHFNEATISHAMSTLGLTYTKEDKTTADYSLRNITEVEFLKRKWRYDRYLKRYVAPLRLDRLLETLNWTKSGPYQNAIPCDNVDTILRELSLHSPDVFNFWAPKILEQSRSELNHWPKSSDRKELLKEVTSQIFYY